MVRVVVQELWWFKRGKLKFDCSISHQGNVVQVPKGIRGGGYKSWIYKRPKSEW